MKIKHRKFERVLQDQLKDPEFRREWEASEAHYLIVSAIIGERVRRNLTQEQLAEKAGLKQPSLARVESGSVVPSLQILGKIAKALDSKLEIRFTPR